MNTSDEVVNEIISLYYSDTSISQKEIAYKLGIICRTVQYWIEKHKNNEGCDRPKRGRPSKRSLPKEVRKAKLQIKRSQREDPSFHAQEAESRERARKRKNCPLPNIEESSHDVKRQKMDIDLNRLCEQPGFKKLEDWFSKAVADGPSHPCCCCDLL